jgi:palmitoyltransferase ZDHHC9/14/18
MTSTIIAGTKRKFQDIMGSMKQRVKSEGNQMSAKRRKLYTGNTKTKHANVHSEVARERAEREAAEHSRQIASRQTRALKRSTPATNSRRQNSKYLRNQLPTIKSTRITTVSFQRKVPKPGALKAVKHHSQSRAISRPTKAAPSGKRSQLRDRPSTPTGSSHDSEFESDEDNSPNITPASLRSASKKLTPISPDVGGRLKRIGSTKSTLEKAKMSRTYAKASSKIQQRAVKGASAESNEANGETKSLNHPAQSRSRTTSGRWVTP